MMFSWLLRTAGTASRLGTADCRDSRLSKRIILCNQIAFCMAFSCIPYFFVYRFLGAPAFGWEALFSAVAYFSIPLINRAGGIAYTRPMLIIVAGLAVTGSAIGLGKSTGVHLFLLPLGWVALVLFEWEERKSIAFGIGFSSLLLLAFEIFGSSQGLLLTPTQHNVRIIHFSVVFTTLVSQILVVLYFFQANRGTEAALAKAGEAALAADKAKSQFLANMSHEIRTPLNGILGMSSLLLKAELRNDQKDLVQAIQSSGLDLMAIISEILDLSKIEAGKMRLESIPFDPRATVEAVLRPFKHEARRKLLDLSVEIPPDLPALLMGDSTRLKQVLNNLLGNAVKFTQKGEVTLRVRSEKAAGPGRDVLLRFEVQDSGIGIPTASQDRIFQSFSQGEDASTRRFGGTGLGLFISRQIVELMGGKIGFTSRPGEGSLFKFEIPFKYAPPSKAAPAEASLNPATPASAPDLRLLIVEDHPLNQKVLAGFLSHFGCRIDAVGGGHEALQVFNVQPYDLVFMDCHMPGMDGFECTRSLRGIKHPAKRPIIIGVTADAMLGTREKCLEAGMDDVLTKPILSSELNHVLIRWLGVGMSMAPSEPAGKAEPSDWVDVGHLREMDEWIRTYDPAFWDRAVDQFRGSAQRLIASIREAGTEGKFSEAGESAHTLKGLCLMMGLSRLGETCKSLETGTAMENSDWLARIEILETLIEPSLLEMQKRIRRR